MVVDQTSNTVMSLGDVIKSSDAEALFAHGSFPKGSPPSTFQSKKGMAFIPKETEEFAKIKTAVENSGKLDLLWVVRAKDKKVGPKGLAIVNTKQVIVKGTGDEKV